MRKVPQMRCDRRRLNGSRIRADYCWGRNFSYYNSGSHGNGYGRNVSKILEDDHISEKEFSLVLSELEKFNNMEEEVRSKTKASIDDETKQSFIGREKEEMIASFQNAKRKT